MKRIFLFSFLGLCIEAYAAEYLSKEYLWNVGTYDIMICDCFTDPECCEQWGDFQPFSVAIGDDFIISGVEYKKLNLTSVNDEYVIGFLRQEGQRIYIKKGISEDELLLYDFGLNVGDSILTYSDKYISKPYSKVINTDTIILKNGVRAKRIFYDNERYCDIEYVGNVYSFYFEGAFIMYNSFYMNDEIVFCEAYCNDFGLNVCERLGITPPCEQKLTDFENISIESSQDKKTPIKQLQDGHVLLLFPDGRRFDVLGREIK